MTIEELELRVIALERNCADLQRWKRETINSNKAQDRLKRKQESLNQAVQKTQSEQKQQFESFCKTNRRN